MKNFDFRRNSLSMRKRSPQNPLKPMIIVENFRSTTTRIVSSRPSINPSRTSTLSRRTPLRSNAILPKLQPSLSSTIEIDAKKAKEKIVTTEFEAESSVLQRRHSLNETISSGSEFETIRTDRHLSNETINVELKSFIKQYREKVKQQSKTVIEPIKESVVIDDDRATLDLLQKIRHGPTSVPIGPMPLSQQACRFELPFDLKILEFLTPIEYLGRYCRLSGRRQYQFKRIFNKYRNRDLQVESADLYASIRDLHKENFTTTIYNELCHLIDLNGQTNRFNFETFAGILAFSERLLCNDFLLRNDYDTVLLSKDPIERCDFDSLTRKFDGLKISEKMKRLLNTL